MAGGGNYRNRRRRFGISVKIFRRAAWRISIDGFARRKSFIHLRRRGCGRFYSNIVKARIPEDETELTLSKQVAEKKIDIPANVKIIEFESPSLSAFWGRTIKMQISVVLPPDYDKSKTQKYPTFYWIHGFNGNHLSFLEGVPNLQNLFHILKNSFGWMQNLTADF